MLRVDNEHVGLLAAFTRRLDRSIPNTISRQIYHSTAWNSAWTRRTPSVASSRTENFEAFRADVLDVVFYLYTANLDKR
ncbi:unnamed protein product [Xylocopa violacea]|uniref:Uncharacterized protein n=1 Tax=Xylocopa violacea TaxID=135666 RepID=A0ABP1NPG8_XYLVO